MHRMFVRLVCAGLLAASLAHAAAVPRLVSYQGFLTGSGGPITGTHTLTFRLYTAATGGAAIWDENRSLTLDAGLFSTTLGEVTPLTLPFDQQYWLGISVDGAAELAPRTKLSGAPYSMRTSAVEDGAVVGSSIAAGAVVKSLNGLRDDVTLAPGANVNFDVAGNTVTINSTGGASSWTTSGTNQYSSLAGNVGVGSFAPNAKLHVNAGTGDVLRLQQNGSTKLLLDGAGRLAVGGLFTPQAPLHLQGGLWDLGTTEGDFKIGDSNYRLAVGVATAGAGAGTVRLRAKSAGSGTGALILGMNTSDMLTLTPTGDIGIGTNSPASKLDVAGTIRTSVITITGGSDVAEPFEVTDEEAIEPGTVMCIDPADPGRLTPSTRPYDRRVAGVVSGAGGVRPGLTLTQEGSAADGQHPVALSGRVYCRVDASDAPIEPGDLLTTSATRGHAAKVTDHGQANGAVLGKALTGLASGRGLVLVLVGLQ